MNNDELTAKLLAEHYQKGVTEERERIFSKIKEWDISGDVYEDLIKVIMGIDPCDVLEVQDE